VGLQLDVALADLVVLEVTCLPIWVQVHAHFLEFLHLLYVVNLTDLLFKIENGLLINSNILMNA
jgi:hypothetical protein